MKAETKSRPRHAGQDARKWRRALAGSATKPDDSIRTIKFKLDFGDSQPARFEDVRALNKIVDGVGAGSLTGLLLAIHASGFRLFSSEAATSRFRDQAAMSSEFEKEFRDSSGLQLKDFSPAAIRNRFQIQPRARAGKDASFSQSVIAREYARHFTGKNLDKLLADEVAFFEGWAHELHAEFSAESQPWRALAEQPERAAATLDGFCSQRSWVTAPVAPLMTGVTTVGVWSSVTIAYDDTQPQLNLDEETLLHQVVAMRLQQVRRANPAAEGGALRKEVQKALTSETSAGLSWLFGRGLSLLKQSSVEEIRAGLGAPSHADESIAKIKHHADSIGEDLLFGAQSFADYRRIIGGRLDSWVANYLNRLLQIKGILDAEHGSFSPSAELVALWPQLSVNATLSLDRLQLLLVRVAELKSAALEALQRLLGLQPSVGFSEDVVRIEEYAGLVTEARASLAVVKNLLAQRSEEEDNAERRAVLMRANFEIPTWLEDVPAINRLSAAIPDFESELAEAPQFFSEIREQRSHCFARLREWAAAVGQPLDPLGQIALREVEQLRGTPAAGSEKAARRQAAANILHRFARASFRGSLPLRMAVRGFYESLGVIADKALLNRFFINQQGALYRSPMSRSKHQAYRIDWENLERYNIIDELEKFTFSVLEESREARGVSARDVLVLEQSFYGLCLAGLVPDVPAQEFPFSIPEGLTRVPTSLTLALKGASLPANTVQKAFNLYASALSGLEVLLQRESFFIRARFQRVGDTTLHYVPKLRPWDAPERLWETDKPVSAFLNDSYIQFTDATRKIIDPAATLESFFSKPRECTPSLAAYLAQAPHDWCYEAGIGGDGAERLGLPVDGKTGVARKMKLVRCSGRLVGPSSFKSELGKLMIPEGPLRFGDITVIFDQEFKQEVTWSAALKPQIQIHAGAIETSIAIPLQTVNARLEAFPLAEKLVAIDQGEVGIGFAVFDVRERRVLETGNVRIPSIRRLIKSAAQYRKKGQKSQKFQQRFDSTLFVMRENVVGDVCQAITSLMRKFKAFPVLESQVRNLEGGSRQLDLVYKAVSTRFLYSDTDAHKAERKSYWLGADRWVHPFLEKYEWVNGARVESTKALSLFPGAAGPTAGTSQVCSECLRNPIASGLELAATNNGTVHIREGGKLTLANGTIILRETPDEAEAKRYIRRNERVPLTVPVSPLRLSVEELKRIIRRNLRQPHISRQSRDTTQSIYHCLYIDCGKVQHADQNAAVNIGRRFLEELVAN